MPWGLMTPASWVAMFTQRYMHEYRRQEHRRFRRGLDLDPQARHQQPGRVLLWQGADARRLPECLAMICRAAAPVRLLPGNRWGVRGDHHDA